MARKSKLCRKSKGPSRMINSTTNITKNPNLRWKDIQSPKTNVRIIDTYTCVIASTILGLKNCNVTKYVFYDNCGKSKLKNSCKQKTTDYMPKILCMLSSQLNPKEHIFECIDLLEPQFNVNSSTQIQKMYKTVYVAAWIGTRC